MRWLCQKYKKLQQNPAAPSATLVGSDVDVTNQNLFIGFSALGLDTFTPEDFGGTPLHLEARS